MAELAWLWLGLEPHPAAASATIRTAPAAKRRIGLREEIMRLLYLRELWLSSVLDVSIRWIVPRGYPRAPAAS